MRTTQETWGYQNICGTYSYFNFANPGGKVFYSINRVVFVIIYASIIIFATVMLLKEMFVLAGIFLFGMIAITYMVDTEIKRRFSKTSRKLPLTRARIIDEEYENLLENEEQIVEEHPRETSLSRGRRDWTCQLHLRERIEEKC